MQPPLVIFKGADGDRGAANIIGVQAR